MKMYASLYLPQRLTYILFHPPKPADGFPLSLICEIRNDPQSRNRKGKNVYGNLLMVIIGETGTGRL